MKKYFVVVALIATIATTHAQRMERGSYLTRTEPSVRGLLIQLRNNRAVMDRYMRHYAMTAQEVESYFATLHVAKLPEDRVVLMYAVPKSGEFRARVYKFRKGTLVFADAAGNPILKLSCGNPLTRGPMKPTEASSTYLTVPGKPIEDVQGEEVAPAPEEEMPEAAVVEPDVPAEIPEAAPAPTEGPIITPGTEPAPLDFGRVLPIIPIIGLIWTGLGEGPPPPPVPEPATVLALSTGVGLLVAKRRARRG